MAIFLFGETMKEEEHLLARCVVSETQVFGRQLTMVDFAHAEEICVQMYMDALGHGINKRVKPL